MRGKYVEATTPQRACTCVCVCVYVCGCVPTILLMLTLTTRPCADCVLAVCLPAVRCFAGCLMYSETKGNVIPGHRKAYRAHGFCD